jgi:arylamine N-acetyltransferase
LGFGVNPLGGRVVWMNPAGLDGPLPAQTHLTLAVTIPGVDDVFLVDVGFGGQTPSSPIRLVAGPEQETRHEPYRLGEHGDGFVLDAKRADVWQSLYLFTTRPQPLIDQVVGSWYVSTNPESTFVVGPSAAGHRRRAVEPAGSQPGDPPNRRRDGADPIRHRRTGSRRVDEPVRD